MEKFKMEAWKEELYHYGVKGMKWRNRRGSAIAKEYREDANELAYDRQVGDSKKYLKWNQKKQTYYRNTAKAIEKGRPAPRRKFQYDRRPVDASSLKRREKVSGTTAKGASKLNSGLQSKTYNKTRSRVQKKKVDKFVKRVLK